MLSVFDDISECFNLIMNGLLDLLMPIKKFIEFISGNALNWLSNGPLAKARHLHDVTHCWALKSGCASDWSSYRILYFVWSTKFAYFSDLVRVSWENFGGIFNVQKADGLSALFIRASSCMARLVTVLINKCIESFSVKSGHYYTCI